MNDRLSVQADSSDKTVDDVQMPPAPPMTIRHAKELFRQYQQSVESDYATLFRVFRERGIDIALPNSNYLHGLGLIDGMFSETRRSLRMLTGNASEAIPSLLFKPFEKMLLRIKEAKGQARIIVIDGSADELEPLRAKYSETLEVAMGTATQGSRVSHFIVCDSDMVREEEYHQQLTDDDPADLIKAKVYCSNRGKAIALSQLFDGIWTKLKATSS